MKKINSTLKLILTVLCALVYTATVSAQECGIVYVTPTGSSSGTAGTPTNPANLTYGLTLASASADRVWLATGTYPITDILNIPSNVTIEGGFNSSTWVKSNVAQSIIDRDASNVLPTPYNALVGLVGNASTNFRLQDLTINVASAPSNQISVYGIYLAGCSNYYITRCTVNTGAGSAGIAGTLGTPGAPGADGSPGVSGGPEGTAYPGGAGGIGVGGNNGGNGANGGKWNGSVGPGSPGLPVGCGGNGGNTGSGPSCGFFSCGSCSDASPGTVGTIGSVGTIGAPGTVGPAGSIVMGYWVPGGAGSVGGVGTDGCGGGGGGGGGGDQQSGGDGIGGSGGGGGAGGAGGTGGIGGTGGGSSYAIFLFTNGAGGNITDCFLNPGPAGLGGAGGPGGPGGPGGAGGAGGLGACPQENGAAGGAGGAGGQGGNGGVGADGESVALKENGGTPANSSNITAVPGNPPVIDVTNYGCTNSEVVISTTASGTWNFGAGASPATATGTGPFSVFYPTLGRRTITLDGTNFSEYVDIFKPGPSSSGSILPSNGTVTLGCPNAFNTVLTGTYYEWNFGPTANPSTMQGATMQSVNNIYFTAPGTYTIYVYVTTNCCGRLLDSTTVTVTPSNFDITLTATPASACIGDPITFTASPTNYLVYVFTVNDSVVQNGPLTSYTSSSFALGDSVVVTALQGTCFTNPSDIAFPIVFAPPTVTIISSDPDSTICEGENVLFIATPIGYTNYEFFDGTTSLQSGPNINYSTSSLMPGNSITVVASNQGCVGSPSAASVTTVNLNPDVILTTSDSILCGGSATVTFTASPSGFTNYNFIENGSSIQNGASNTYSVVLTSTSTVEVITTSSNGCIDSTSAPVTTSVNPIPTVTLESSDADNVICENELITFTATPTGYDNYEFFNAGVSVQNGAINSYSTTLLSSNSITVIATDLGCPSLESSPIVVSIIPADVVDAGVDIEACINATPITLNPVTPSNGIWAGTGSSGTSFNPSIAGAGAHNLVYSFTNSSGCTGYDTAIATVYALPLITTTPSAPVFCEGSPLSITANGATTYTWSPATGLSATTGTTVVATPTQTTVYTLAGTSNNCTDSISFTLTVNEMPEVTISGTSAINACEEAVLIADVDGPMGGTYNWTPLVNLTCNTCQTASAAPTATQNYTVTYTTPQGCSDSASVTVTIVSIFNYFMPTAFTPNKDGVNDTLHIHGKGIETVSLKLFNRIGEKVFETSSIYEGWDGTQNGVPVNNGTYIYVLDLVYCNGEKVKEHGNVTLVK